MLTGPGAIRSLAFTSASLPALGSVQREEQLRDLVRFKLEKNESSAWSFKIGSKDIVLRDQADKIAKAVLFVKGFVDSALTSEPHAALAWAGVCILLPVLFTSTSNCINTRLILRLS